MTKWITEGDNFFTKLLSNFFKHEFKVHIFFVHLVNKDEGWHTFLLKKLIVFNRTNLDTDGGIDN